MNEANSINIELENIRESKPHYFQVDVLKAIMIFLVIFDHTIPWDIKYQMGVGLWERISIPVFLVIIGFNMGNSFKQKGDVSLKALYSKSYFKKKITRYIIPFLILYIVSTIVGLAINNFDWDALNQYQSHWAPEHLIMGILPYWGPGNWFLPIIFQSILIMPILYKGFEKKPLLTLILCFALEIFLNIFVILYVESLVITWFFRCSFIMYISAVALGMWFSNDYDITANQNSFMWILFLLSASYIMAYHLFGFQLGIIMGDYHYIVFPYSAFLFLIGMNILPSESKNKFTDIVGIIGKSTYHILLTQILYLAIVYNIYGDHYRASIIGINLTEDIVSFVYLVVNWGICIPLGVLWYCVEMKIRKWRLEKRNS